MASRFSPGRRFQRVKREGAWVGNIALSQLVGTTPVLRELWSPGATQGYLTAGHVTHQVSHVYLGLRPGSIAAAGVFAWGVKVYDTDATGSIPGALVLDPLDPNSLDQEYLDWGFATFSPNTANAGSAGLQQFTVHREIRAKRRFSDTQSLGIVVVSTVASTGYDIGYRTFCRVAKP